VEPPFVRNDRCVLAVELGRVVSLEVLGLGLELNLGLVV